MSEKDTIITEAIVDRLQDITSEAMIPVLEVLGVYDRNGRTVGDLRRLFRRTGIRVHPDKAPEGQKDRYTIAQTVLNRSLSLLESESLYADWKEREFCCIRNANIRSNHVVDNSVLFSMHPTDIEKCIASAERKADTADEVAADVVVIHDSDGDQPPQGRPRSGAQSEGSGDEHQEKNVPESDHDDVSRDEDGNELSDEEAQPLDEEAQPSEEEAQPAEDDGQTSEPSPVFGEGSDYSQDEYMEENENGAEPLSREARRKVQKKIEAKCVRPGQGGILRRPCSVQAVETQGGDANCA